MLTPINKVLTLFTFYILYKKKTIEAYVSANQLEHKISHAKFMGKSTILSGEFFQFYLKRHWCNHH